MAKSSTGRKSTKGKAATKARTNHSNKVVLEITLNDPNNVMSVRSGDYPIIGYQFNRDRITVLSLTIENKSISHPGDSGNIVLDYIPLSGQIHVTAYATGQGSGSLQLTYQQKNLFNPAEDFNFTNGHGFINELVKIQ